MSFSKRLYEAIHDGVEADEPPPAECDCGDPRCCGEEWREFALLAPGFPAPNPTSSHNPTNPTQENTRP